MLSESKQERNGNEDNYKRANNEGNSNQAYNSDEKGSSHVQRPPLVPTSSATPTNISIDKPINVHKAPPPAASMPNPYSKYSKQLKSNIPMDTNFVQDKWDESDDEDEPLSRGQSNQASRVNSRPNTTDDVGSASRSVSRNSFNAGVKEDTNWLDNNFDD